MHPNSIFDDPHMDGKIISSANQWLWFEAQILLEITEIVKICQGDVSPSFGPFEPCNVSRLLSNVSNGAWMPLMLYNQ
jgi:hypothetical protein